MKKTIGRLISILHRQSQIYMNEALREYGITSAEYSFLLTLYRQSGLTQDELSSFLCIDKAATARAIKSLEEKGYINRNKDDNDKRYNRVTLTEKAMRYKTEIRQKVYHWSEMITEGLEEEEKEFLYDLLEEMVQKVDIKYIKEIEEK